MVSKSESERGQGSFIDTELVDFLGPDFEQLIRRGLNGLGVKLKHLDLFRRPSHENSDARYILEEETDEDWIGIYALLPNEKTSEHEHPEGLLEIYLVLKGEMKQTIGEQVHFLKEGETFTIYPGQRHFSSTGSDQSALVIVLMKGAAQYQQDQRHQNSSRPSL